MCPTHYLRWFRARETGARCSICSQPAFAKGWCSTHYQRWRKHGDPTIIKVQRGDPYDSIISIGVDLDPEDGCFLWKGRTVQGYGTIVRKAKGLRLYAHRVSYEKWFGHIPVGKVVDHECHNLAAREGRCAGGATCKHRRCVNPSHLRAVTWKENMQSSPLTRHREST